MLATMVAPDAITAVVARLLTEAKERSGLSFTQLGITTGLGRASVVRYLSGERSPQIGPLFAICAALDINAADVLNEAQNSLS